MERIDVFKTKYYEIKKIIIDVLNYFIRNHNEFCLSTNERKQIVNINFIMELSKLFHDYFLCHFRHIYEDSYNNIYSTMIVDDSSVEDLQIYASSYIFIEFVDNNIEYDEIIRKLLDLADDYATYLYNSDIDVFQMIEMEESMDGLSVTNH